MEFLGPQWPSGRKASPVSREVPADTKNVPTYCHPPSQTPATAQNQLDNVFASRRFHDDINISALNFVQEWQSERSLSTAGGFPDRMTLLIQGRNRKTHSNGTVWCPMGGTPMATRSVIGRQILGETL